MPRKPHPADLFNGSVIANAVEWSAFTQAGGRLTRHFGSRVEARHAAQRMADQFRRPALVCAIDGNGRSAVGEAAADMDIKPAHIGPPLQRWYGNRSGRRADHLDANAKARLSRKVDSVMHSY